jgi:hypothetical protein
MLAELLIGAGTITAGGFAYTRTRRARHYRSLTDRLQSITGMHVLDLSATLQRSQLAFAHYLACVPEFLPACAFAALADEAKRLVGPERSFIPAHKKGGTVAYETLIATSPNIVSFYHSRELHEFLSRLIGVRIVPTPIHDQSSLSVLFYEKPGDHIGWHFDHNFYRGRHFTVLLAIRNEGRAAGRLSHAVLEARLDGRETSLATAPNTLVVFEGAKVQHKVTPILDGERRLVLSMTFCTEPRSYWWQGISRRIKDTAFFGIRALWT